MYLFLSVCLLLHFDIYLVIRVHRATGKIGMCVRVCINICESAPRLLLQTDPRLRFILS